MFRFEMMKSIDAESPIGRNTSNPWRIASATNCASAHSPFRLSERRGDFSSIIGVRFCDEIKTARLGDFVLYLTLVRRLAVGSDFYLDADESSTDHTNDIGYSLAGDARTIYTLFAVIRGAVVDSVCRATPHVNEVVNDRVGKSICGRVAKRRLRDRRRGNMGILRRVHPCGELAQFRQGTW